VAGNGNQDKVVVLRHSHKETESNELLHLSLRRHSLTLPRDIGPVGPPPVSSRSLTRLII
jgi:hypothetical protein